MLDLSIECTTSAPRTVPHAVDLCIRNKLTREIKEGDRDLREA